MGDRVGLGGQVLPVRRGDVGLLLDHGRRRGRGGQRAGCGRGDPVEPVDLEGSARGPAGSAERMPVLAEADHGVGRRAGVGRAEGGDEGVIRARVLGGHDLDGARLDQRLGIRRPVRIRGEDAGDGRVDVDRGAEIGEGDLAGGVGEFDGDGHGVGLGAQGGGDLVAGHAGHVDADHTAAREGAITVVNPVCGGCRPDRHRHCDPHRSGDFCAPLHVRYPFPRFSRGALLRQTPGQYDGPLRRSHVTTRAIGRVAECPGWGAPKTGGVAGPSHDAMPVWTQGLSSGYARGRRGRAMPNAPLSLARSRVTTPGTSTCR